MITTNNIKSELSSNPSLAEAKPPTRGWLGGFLYNLTHPEEWSTCTKKCVFVVFSLMQISAAQAKPTYLPQLHKQIRSFDNDLQTSAELSLSRCPIEVVTWDQSPMSYPLVNSELQTQELMDLAPLAPPLSDKWLVSVDPSLHQAPGFEKYPIVDTVDIEDHFPNSKFDSVGWSHYLIHSVKEKSLYTRELGPCVAIAARGYNQQGELTHIGLAHKFITDIHKVFFEEMRKTVGEGYIEAFLAGGGLPDASYVKEIIADASLQQIKIVDNLTTKFFKNFILTCKDWIYSGSSGIRSVYFDSSFNLRLHGDITFTAFENLSEALSKSLCQIKASPIPMDY